MARKRYVLRLASELTRKSNKTRRRFQRRLVANLRDALSSVSPGGFDIEDRWSRIFVELEEPEASRVFRRVFGVHSFSLVDGTVPADLARHCRMLRRPKLAPQHRNSATRSEPIHQPVRRFC